MILQNPKEKVESFLSSRAENAIGHHQLFVYLLHLASG